MRRKIASSKGKWLLLLIVVCLGFLLYDMSKADLLGGLEAEAPVVKMEENNLSADDQASPTEAEVQQDISNVLSNKFSGDYRIQREQIRSKELEILQGIIDDANSTEPVRSQAQQQQIQISASMEKELKAETLLTAKGFEDAVVLLMSDKANVIIGQKIDEVEATQIAELVDGATAIGYENVVVIQKK